ncbi:MAG: type III polyketide synthase [bacterium]|nr:type III polyketide synthase [bacterium]
MPKICGVTIALPPYRVPQSEAAQFAQHHFGTKIGDLHRMMQVFANAGINTRYFSRPVNWHLEPHTIAEKNEVYIESATNLCLDASRRLLERNHLAPTEIDYIIYVNTTGLATPSIDARLINLLGCRQDIRRTPIWGLGCAGGVAGLSHAYHHALGHPRDRILLVAAELCGLTFIPDDFSRSNLVATALFGEGAAAVLVCGDEVSLGGYSILGTQSRFYPDSLDVMGWHVVSQGLQVVFAQRIPDIVAANAKQDFSDFLNKHELRMDDIKAYLFHPGGMKVIDAYRQALGFTGNELALSEEILRDYGNMSSVSVLFVLERFMQRQSDPGGHGLISALGPGFCSESMLISL